ncbi:MAG: phenylacetate--CoA ligase family protein [Porphyromonas sp.]
MKSRYVTKILDICSGALGQIQALRAVCGKDTDEIESYQFRELKRLIDFAWEHIPFYRRYWEHHGFTPEQFQRLQDFSLIPCIDKEIVRANYKDMVPRNYDRGRLEQVTSGGTTGLPLSFYINQAIAHGRELVHQPWTYWHVCRYKLGIDKVVILRGSRVDEKLIQQGIYWKRSLGYRGRGFLLSSFHLTEATYKSYMHEIRKESPKFIVAYPSSLTILCTMMKKHNEAPLRGLRGAICSSEMVYEWQRQLVREVLGVEIYSFYGHSEKTVSAIPDSQHRMLFEPSYGYVEFLDEKLNPVNTVGEIAQVVSTGFQNDYMPFIRYQTSDYVRVDNHPPLGFTHVAKEIIGRAQDFVYDKDGNRLPFTCSDEVFWNIDGIIAYQYLQREVGRLLIHLEVDNSFINESIQNIQIEAEHMFYNCDVEVLIVDRIERTSSGKFRYFVQTIK